MRRASLALCLLAAFLSVGCERAGRWYWLANYDRDIRSAGRTIDAAKSDAERARAHARRGRGYSEKARYCRFFKLLSVEEYGELFRLAIRDHRRAIELDSGAAELYFDRGMTYYDRAMLEEGGERRKHFLQLAEADFGEAARRDARHSMAFDMRGLSYLAENDYERAIADFTQEARLDPAQANRRLADAHCNRGIARHRAKRYVAAASDLELAVGIGAAAEGCECNPYGPLLGVYLEQKLYDKARALAARAKARRKWISPELLERLKRAP